ncbi:protein NRT1/ PTR FAMILY 8.3-like [Phoenix dactylifera]|uniref:Protein NRT1/ PTR FAMILY 8.3-like n=1 Tax=Phoenix dactylifera TaxID=42345 RepID=A0A8B7MV72_PHODC|nr:protein NRT1/ PTR FAMILY 8.3-like [Phoenix dactylifera]
MEDENLSDGGREVTAPLVYQEALNRQFNDDITFEGRGRSISCCKSFDWRAPGIILGFQCLESLGFYGITTNLTTYLSSVLRESNALIATRITTWSGTSYFTPFLGALIADSYWGRRRMIVSSSLIYLCGMVVITLSASLRPLKPPPCEGNSCPSATLVQKIAFYSGLYLIAFGSGGVKSSLLPLGADQFDDENPAERMKQGSFFNWFYFCINVGALTSSTLIVWIQENVGWAVGYGIASLCMASATVCFLLAVPIFRVREPQASPLKRVFQVLVACLHKANLRSPADSSCLYEVVQDNDFNIQRTRKLAHTKQFRFLDKAATMSDLDCKEGSVYSPWRLCTVTQVEELKIFLRLFPIWVASIVYSIAYAQMYTTFVEQGRAMNTKIGCFSIPPASLFACEVLSVMLWVLIYDMLIAKIARSYLGGGHGLTQLQRMGIGYFLIILAMAAAALVEMKRLKGTQDPKPISILWQLPQYAIVGGSEVFCYIGQLELFYDQSPDTMSTAVSLLSISLGNYLSSVVVAFVAAVTTAGGRPGWIPDDSDEGHLDYFLWLMAGLSVFNFIAYLACARRFTLKRTVL